MTTLDELRPTERLLVMDLVAQAGLDVDDWSNYAGKHPASNPRYCYEWVFSEEGLPPVACLWFGNIEVATDGVARQRLNLWKVAKKHELLPGRSAVAKRARAMDLVIQTAFRKKSPMSVILVDGEKADLETQSVQSSKVERRKLDPSAWIVAEYDWSTGDALLVRQEKILNETAGSPMAALNTGAASTTTPTYVARLAYNSHHWRRPATAAEVKEAGETYRNENGFGHEDWLFRDEWQLDGWRYGFVQGVNRSREKLLRERRPFNLRLFTMPAPGERRAVAEIRGVECLNDTAAEAAVSTFEDRGWLDTMRAEVAAAGGRPEALDETGHAPHILNLRYRIENLRMLDASMPLRADDPANRLNRYGLYRTSGVLDAAVDNAPLDKSPPSANDFVEAFSRVEMSDNQRRWIVAHYYSPDATTSMLQLSKVLGYSDHRVANGAYGALAHKIADELHRAPEGADDDDYVDWMQAVATLVDRDALNHSQWRLRDEVIQAMVALGWVEALDTVDGALFEHPTQDDQILAREYSLDDTQLKQMMMSRRKQGRFRNETLRFWGGCCAVSGLKEAKFLVASHIKPWKDATPNERMDGFNGLPLTPNLDRAFDQGYVSFADDRSIMISTRMSLESIQALGIRPDMALRFRDERICKYLAYHREHVFLRPAQHPASCRP